jgi:hypothetical protein
MNIRLRRDRAVQAAPTASLGGRRPAGPDVIIPEPRTEAPLEALHVTTPFEDWCDATGVHPEALGAWETFVREMPRGA